MYGCRLEMEHTRNFKCLGGLSPGIWQFSLSLKGIKYLRNSPWEKDLKKKTDSWSSDRWWHERSAGFWSPQCLKEHVPWDKRRSRRLYPEETPPDVKLFSVLFSCLLPFHHLPVTFLSDAKRQYFALSVIRALNLQNLGNWSSNYHLFNTIWDFTPHCINYFHIHAMFWLTKMNTPLNTNWLLSHISHKSTLQEYS